MVRLLAVAADLLALTDAFRSGSERWCTGLGNARFFGAYEGFERVKPYLLVDQGLTVNRGAWVPGVGGGAEVVFGRLSLSVEVVWSAWNRRTRSFTQPYVGFADRGIVHGGIGASYRYGGPK